jgi:hypothetical protein
MQSSQDDNIEKPELMMKDQSRCRYQEGQSYYADHVYAVRTGENIY